VVRLEVRVTDTDRDVRGPPEQMTARGKADRTARVGPGDEIDLHTTVGTPRQPNRNATIENML